MTVQDLVAIASAIVAVAAIAYAVWNHRQAKAAREDAARARATARTPKVSSPEVEDAKQTGEAPAKELTSAPKPEVVAVPTTSPAGAASIQEPFEPESRPPKAFLPPPLHEERRTVKLKEQAGDAPEVEVVSVADLNPFEGIEKAHFEDDDDVDPTRVGQAVPRPKTLPPKQTLEPTVAPIVYDEDAATDEPTRTDAFFLVSATAQTDKGLRRARNEDSLLVDKDHDLFVVADGMGGYHGGELASQLAVKTISKAFGEPREIDANVARNAGLSRDALRLARAIQAANEIILEAATKEQLEGMGTTVCAARFSLKKKRLFIGHVGDSRCYRLRDGLLSQLTVDHTMREFGVTGPESRELSRAVGIWQSVPIDLVQAIPALGDVYLLCSDGLTKMLKDDTIATVLRNEEDPQAAVDRLISFANAHGGKDNITVILVRVVEPLSLSDPPAKV